jgi:ABC-type bacteriocin/lantibiotic exporter with double-glycine peptidase domain
MKSMLISPVCETDWDCGLVASKYLTILLGGEWLTSLDEAALIGKSTPEDGTPHEGILDLLAYGGLRFVGKTFQTVAQVPIPAIVNYQSDGDGHYGVVVSKTTENVFIFDPADGVVRTFTFSEFDEVFYSLRYGRMWAAIRL